MKKSFHNEKRQKHSYICQYLTTEIQEKWSKSARIEKRNRWIHNYSWRVQLLSEIERISREKINKNMKNITTIN